MDETRRDEILAHALERLDSSGGDDAAILQGMHTLKYNLLAAGASDVQVRELLQRFAMHINLVTTDYDDDGVQPASRWADLFSWLRRGVQGVRPIPPKDGVR
jgi:hypothetical protein